MNCTTASSIEGAVPRLGLAPLSNSVACDSAPEQGSMAPQLPIRPLGKQGLQASAQGLGCMSLSNKTTGDLGSEAESVALIQKALATGITLLNTADMYGPHENHKLIGKAIKNAPRGEIIIASKWGPMIDSNYKFTHDGSPEYARKSLQLSLSHLGVDYIDLYILRSKDPKVPIEESVKAMAELVKEGLVKGIGLSEVSAANIRKAHAVHPITAIEMEWSLFSRDAERDLVPTCRELGIAFLAYSPLGRGMLTDNFSLDNLAETDFRRKNPRFAKEAMEQNMRLVEKARQLADKKGCTLGQLALSWVHHQGDDVFPIPGTKQIKYLEENIAAFDIKLSKQELAEIDQLIPHDQVVGDRYPKVSFTYRADDDEPVC